MSDGGAGLVEHIVNIFEAVCAAIIRVGHAHIFIGVGDIADEIYFVHFFGGYALEILVVVAIHDVYFVVFIEVVKRYSARPLRANIQTVQRRDSDRARIGRLADMIAASPRRIDFAIQAQALGVVPHKPLSERRAANISHTNHQYFHCFNFFYYFALQYNTAAMTTKVQKIRTIAKKIVKWTAIFFGLFLLYVVIMLIYGTATDFQPEEKIVLTPQAPKPVASQKIDRPELSALIWNIGFGGFGAKADFFYDAGGFFFANGKMVRSPKADVDAYMQGIDSFFKTQRDKDFIMLQEVDSQAHRSYYINQITRFSDIFEGYQYTFGVNFNVGYVPMPVARPWDVIGSVYSGVATYLRYPAQEAVRYQLPGDFGWPMRIFNLDRCMVVHRIPTTIDKDFVLINAHLSAYDTDGSLRRVEMEYLRKFVLAEYEKGNYVVAGADWNQCPPNFIFNKFKPEMTDSSNYPGNVAADFMPAGWTWAADTTLTTNRKLVTPYDRQTSFSTLVDYYLLSPNVEALEVKGIDLDYQFSDHQPVALRFRLRDWPATDSTTTQ